MSEDQFTKLFKYMQKGFANVDKRFVEIEYKFDKCFDLLTNIIDLDKVHV
jgi:hypothetical protein